MHFDDLDLNEDLLDSIYYMGFRETTPIQEKAIPVILEGDDLIACAQTGTGKTAAFLLPTLNYLLENPVHETNVLIIVPTRELATQIDQQIQGVGYVAGIDSAVICGGGDGDDWAQQRQALTRGSRVIVATPGKLISHLNMGYVKFDTIKHLILDEADRMLDIGFYDDIIKIVSFLPKNRQTLLFSATMAPKIKNLASQILNNPKEISLAIAKPAEKVDQKAYLAHESQKKALIKHIVQEKKDYQSILVFTSTKKKVFDIVRALKSKFNNVEGISSDLEQTERNDVLLRFKSRQTRILVGTDVVSRGIDIKEINLVINYDVPADSADYVHRVGRTARAETKGEAITFINEDDVFRFNRIEKLIEKEVPKIDLPKGFDEGPEYRSFSKKGFKKANGPRGKSKGKPYPKSTGVKNKRPKKTLVKGKKETPVTQDNAQRVPKKLKINKPIKPKTDAPQSKVEKPEGK